MPDTPRSPFRIAVAQTVLRDDPRDPHGLRASGREIRDLVAESARAGARLVQFSEGALCSPGKMIMSVDAPVSVGAADWDRVDWTTHQQELASIAGAAREHHVWVVLGAIHQLSAPNRPHNSLYVISDTGEVVTRYDERFLSKTKVSHLYAPGTDPVTFEVDGIRFGCLLGMEIHFPELFAAYEQLDVDCVLFSTAGPGTGSAEMWATAARGHAATNSFWVAYAGPASQSVEAPSGLVSPDGTWVARCPANGEPAVIVAELDPQTPNLARPWRRVARSDLYAAYAVTDDPRSSTRAAF